MRSKIKLLARATVESYAALLFTSGLRCGAILCALTFAEPRLALGGLLGAAIGNAAALAFSFPPDLIATGIYGVSPLLTGLAVAYFHASAPSAYPPIVPAALLAMTLATLLSDRLFKNFRIGSLSLSFALVAPLFARLAPTGPAIAPPPTAANWVEVFFGSIGAIVFQPNPLVGLGLFLVVLFYSRALAVLAALGFAAGSTLYIAMGGAAPDLAHGMVGLNFALTAMAVGGVFLLSGPAATAHALGAVTVSALVALGVHRLLAPLGLPVFSWPFNIATILWIGTMNLRTSDAKPRGTWGLAGSPEEMAAQVDLHARAASAEFAPALPVIGEWTVTQGVEGEPTHRPPWSYAVDFEVMDASGFPFRTTRIAGYEAPEDPGSRLESYYAFGAPVLAVADGVVELAVSGIFDNPPGSSNTKDNFGNQVIIRHAERIYSVQAHLKYNSVRVRAGDVVRAGQVIAQCGSSGRSPRPHLHFHIQADDRIGSPTLPFVFSQYTVRAENGLIRFRETGMPALFERVTSVASLRGAHPGPRFAPGRLWRFRVRTARGEREETWRSEIDLWGGVRISSDFPRASAAWRVDARGMTAIAFSGSRAGALHALFAGTSRLPAHLSPEFAWTDRPGSEHTMPRLLRAGRGLVMPFAELRGGETTFATSALEKSWRIEARCGIGTIATEWNAEGELLRIERREGSAARMSATRAGSVEAAKILQHATDIR